MDLLILIGGGAAALLAIGALARGVWRINRRIVTIVEAVQELAPNGGKSIKDTVTRTERKVDDAASKVDAAAAKVDDTARELLELKQRFDEHLSTDDGPLTGAGPQAAAALDPQRRVYA